MAVALPVEETRYHWYFRVTGAGPHVPGTARRVAPTRAVPVTLGVGVEVRLQVWRTASAAWASINPAPAVWDPKAPTGVAVEVIEPITCPGVRHGVLSRTSAATPAACGAAADVP